MFVLVIEPSLPLEAISSVTEECLRPRFEEFVRLWLLDVVCLNWTPALSHLCWIWAPVTLWPMSIHCSTLFLSTPLACKPRQKKSPVRALCHELRPELIYAPSFGAHPYPLFIFSCYLLYISFFHFNCIVFFQISLIALIHSYHKKIRSKKRGTVI